MEIDKIVVAEEKPQPMEEAKTKLIFFNRNDLCDDLWPGLAIEREFTLPLIKEDK